MTEPFKILGNDPMALQRLDVTSMGMLIGSNGVSTRTCTDDPKLFLHKDTGIYTVKTKLAVFNVKMGGEKAVQGSHMGHPTDCR